MKKRGNAYHFLISYHFPISYINPINSNRVLLRSHRPYNALVLFLDRSHAFVYELLYALAFVGLGGVDIAL